LKAYDNQSKVKPTDPVPAINIPSAPKATKSKLAPGPLDPTSNGLY
jgi:hypothetical protein